MSKILKLIKNENKKEMKKISTKIFIIVSILFIVVALLFSFLIKFISNSDMISENTYWKQYVEDDIATYKSNLARAKEEKNEIEVKNLELQIKLYQYAIDNDINMYSNSSDWRADSIYEIINRSTILNENRYLMKEEEIKKEEEVINSLQKSIEENNFSNYMQIKKDSLKNDLDNKNIEKDVYDLKLEILELKEKYEIGKSNEEWKYEVITEIEEIKEQLRTNFNNLTNKLLTYEQIQEREKTLKIDLYRLENNIPPISNSMGETNYRNEFALMAESFSMMVVSILAIMMAGSAIATEYSKGTIKFLVMTPNKRWKIIFAKLINAIIIMVVLTVVLSIITLVFEKIFFSNYEAYPYLYLENGEVHSLNHTAYIMLRFLCDDIDIFIYLLLALMLSVITRNTAVSTGVSIATYLGSSIVMTILNTFVKADWVKFIPFNNMGITDKIFTNTTSLTMEMEVFTNNVPLTFSLAVLGVCAILMIVTMFDSFNKRDIK